MKPREPDSEPALCVTRAAGALSLRLNRPAKRNAYSAELRDALCEALALVIQDESIERVTLSGAGPSFCSGGDLDEVPTPIGRRLRVRHRHANYRPAKLLGDLLLVAGRK